MIEQEFFNRYKFNVQTDKIGGGSFGTVYKAYDNGLDREVAIKVSEVKFVGNKEFSLKEEFKAVENLPVNTYIANYEAVHRFVERSGTYDYAVMQYYPLGNLSHYLKNNTVSIEERETLSKDILEGIAFLHKHKVVHRDLKPSNILVVNRKGKLIPKITDFGLSKQADVDAKGSRFTNSFAGGTLQYSSPEQIKGLPLKLNTDLWSFGAIAYEILTNKTLFEADIEGTASAEWQNAITQKILHHDINSELKDLPENWQNVLKDCLEKEVNKRAQNTQKLLSLLNGSNTINKSTTSQLKTNSNNDETVIKENVKLKDNLPNAKTIPFKKKEDPKWLLPNLAAFVLLLIGSIGYFMFFSEDKKPLENKLSIFEKDVFFGYKLGDSIVIEPKFLAVKKFIDGKALVKTVDSSFYINNKGVWVEKNLDTASFGDKLENKSKNNPKATPDKAKKQTDLAEVENSEWQRANTTNTITAYKSFLNKYPRSKYKSLANTKIKNIETAIAAADAKRKKDLLEKEKKAQAAKDAEKVITTQEIEDWFTNGVKEVDKGNLEKGYFLLTKAAKQGYFNAQMKLGGYYRWRHMANDEYQKKALKWYIEAANQGYSEAQCIVGMMYKGQVGIERDYKEALKWFLLSANQGDSDAEFQIGQLYRWGSGGIDQDFKKAMKWYLKAANQENSEAQYYIGLLYEKGLGVTQNNFKAIEWYTNSCDNDERGDACDALKRLE